MDLSQPATVALAAGTASVVRALAGTTVPVSIRRPARIAGVSPSRAHQVVRGLALHGVVKVDDRDGSSNCELNRAHLATGPLVELVSLRSRMLELLVAEISRWSEAPLHASLFGSAARGDGGTASDIDLLVVRRDDSDDDAWTDQLHDAGRRIRDATGNRAAWFDLTEADLRRAVAASEPVIEDWKRDAVHLFGESLRALLRRVA